MHKAFPALVLAGLLAGCARAVTPGSPVTPEEIPALEAAWAERPDDADLATRLGRAYFEAREYVKATDVLRAAAVLNRDSYTARALLGLTYEERGRLDSARIAYREAGVLPLSDRQREDLDNRLVLLTRKELVAEARRQVAQESLLTREPPTQNAVAVFPWRYLGTNDDLRPLERGLTHLVITDLSKVGRLRLLERERVQVLVDELALSDSGRVDPSTGARSGRLLRAASVVQGSLQDAAGEALRMDANVVSATDGSVVATGDASDQLRRLFEMEKAVVLQLIDRLGISLTPEEQRAISERPTADLQAFLSFSRGLEAEDRGDFATATAEYSAALARDPNFRSARQRRSAALSVSAAFRTPPRQFAGVGIGRAGLTRATGFGATRGAILRNAIQVAVPSGGGALDRRLVQSLPPLRRPNLPEALQLDDPRTVGLLGQIIIIIPRP